MGVVAEVVRVSADVPEAFGTDDGLNEQLAPLGSPEQERLTVPLKPKSGATVNVNAAFCPTMIVAPLGLLVIL